MIWVRAYAGKHKPLWKIHVKLKTFCERSEGSLLSLQRSTTILYPEPNDLSPHPPPFFPEDKY
jgi:hypothetical protein